MNVKLDLRDMYGLGRVLEPAGVLPQRAERLDPMLPIRPGEVLIDVESLNIDAASFTQLKQQTGGGPEPMAQAIAEIIRGRGKMHNPVTGSGGILIGRVREVHPLHPDAGKLREGDRVATLVSLTLTPLWIDEVRDIQLDRDRVDVRGHAILFASGLYARLPDDLPESISLAALDVCGAPALAARFVRPGMTVGVMGAGKSGALCLAQARRMMQGQGSLIAMDISSVALARLSKLGLCDRTIAVDATQPVEVLEAVARVTQDVLCDLIINCASVPRTEMATILSVRQGGRAIFFSMATSFTAAALGAEGVGKDVEMIVGNGFVPGHAELTLDLVRNDPAVRSLFEERFC